MNRIDQSLDAIAAIAPEDKIILVDRYIDKVSWEGTARDANCSIGFCRKRAGIALEKLTLMMFGPDAIPLQPSNVVFFKMVAPTADKKKRIFRIESAKSRNRI